MLKLRVAPALGFSLLLLGCDDLRVKVVVFNTLADARAGGAITAGWIPDGLPASVSELRAAYLPDGRQWGVFTFAPKDDRVIRALLGPEISSGQIGCNAPGRLEWWPQILMQTADAGQVRSTGFQLYRQTGSPRVFAINWGQGRAYYWFN